METKDLGVVASLIFILVPAIFLIVLYIGAEQRGLIQPCSGSRTSSTGAGACTRM